VRVFRRLSAVALATSVAAFSAATASAAPTPGPYKLNDFGGFRNVLPPAQGANANANQIAAHQASCEAPPPDPPGCESYPPHTSDGQLRMYRDLMYATPGLSASQIPTSSRTRASA
jgi:hypothetical protein